MALTKSLHVFSNALATLPQGQLTSNLPVINNNFVVDGATISSVIELITAMATNTVPDPVTFATSLILVTASDMIPFVPCQPLAMTLGATLGVWAFPICVLGQTLAGIIAFQLARSMVDDNERIASILDTLSDEAKERFNEFRKLGTNEQEQTVFLAVFGLRLAPFFPFSAGNYLLGAATGTGIRPFALATLFGCLLSNFISVSAGMGGMELLQTVTK
mmetsp:Transcript_16704/g.25438  ORF Transcript_16704/g.25438 Transcript_16704/m.25438 type:complete len:218 (-) Transcript_16704:210-863(-)|eukprot:CAMPEP_0194205002 /NCGR_PEP_ID=MMETSP0156-20130528/4367_1 /TAXON_ID=33649 /ORGANISM="Thalassionema nitzschioides, Strain L26-B" /LENGTH=217 /DNA_ID=CAMNT_0038931151 /DNA_START=60 /DNA_END=713 /DNA_ORIENTATION=+